MATQIQTLATPTLTKETLQAARNACKRASEAGKDAALANKERDAAVAQVFFEMGFRLDEVKCLDPESLAREIRKRTGGVFRIEKEAEGLFVIQKTSQGRYPKWKEEFQLRLGPAAMMEVEGECATQYSYSIVDVASAKPGTGAVLLGGEVKPKAGRKR